MLDDRRRWRRFDPIEVEGRQETSQHGIRRSVLNQALRQEISVLRRMLDLVLDENDKLQKDFEILSRKGLLDTPPPIARSTTPSPSLTTDDLSARLAHADDSIRDLLIELQVLRTQLAACATMKDVPKSHSRVDARKNSPSDTRAQREPLNIDGLSRVVARWFFQSPSEPRVRLVAAAIRNRLRSEV